MTPQYLAVKLDPKKDKTYTYANHGPAAGVGDTVKVSLPHGRRMDGMVMAIDLEAPLFRAVAIMEIVKRAEPEPEPMRDEDFNFGEDASNGL